MLREILVELRAVRERLQEHERRVAGGEMRGKIPSGGVDAEKGLCRIVIGKDPDGNDVLSPWAPYKQTAGAMKFHNPPSEGQVMVIRTEGGDVQQGLAEPFRWNDDNPDPSDAADAHVLTFGNVRVDLSGDAVVVTVGGVTMQISGDGVAVTGGEVRHNGKDIGDTHKHGQVVTGVDETDVPV